MAVGNKNAGAKRSVGEGETRISRKRRKTKADEETSIQTQIQESEKPWTHDPDQVFRFLDLPGELRNRIYEMALEWCTRCFPHTWPKNKKKSKQISSAEEESKIVWPPSKPLPFLGLTQVCTVIRTEFRPLWLSTHRFPLFVLDGYFKAFFPAPLPKSANADLRKRVEKYHDPAGTLRLWISDETMLNADIIKLLKFKIRFPAYTITPTFSQPDMIADLAFLTTIINCTNPRWIKWIQSNTIQQVRVGHCRKEGCRFVVKEKYASLWMKAPFHFYSHDVNPFLKSLGLLTEGIEPRVSFGVDYSS